MFVRSASRSMCKRGVIGSARPVVPSGDGNLVVRKTIRNSKDGPKGPSNYLLFVLCDGLSQRRTVDMRRHDVM